MAKNPHKPVMIWLLSGCALIFLMVIIGGITRLTNSGLSMVDWKLIGGMIPPLNEQEWLESFERYKEFPEYQQVNFMYTLSEYKSIFFWEYLHRLTGRLIGLVFIIPFIFFLVKGYIKGKMLLQCLVILGMGAFQGFLGWWMVKSGLVDDPDVSHYRLAVHLLAAFLTFAYTFWVALSYRCVEPIKLDQPFLRKGITFLLVVVLVQIVYGAFVAGLNAGFIMNTWPKMGEYWFPESVTAMQPLWANFIDGISGVQFVHRYLAYVVVGWVLFLVLRAGKYDLEKPQSQALILILTVVFAQFLLGIFTLLYAVPLWLGVAHQAGAFFLLAAVVFALSVFRREAACPTSR